MTDDLRLRVAKRLCQMFWAYMGDPDRTADEQWQRESRSDCWLIMADAILPLLAAKHEWAKYVQAREKFLGEEK